jgi:hypothetical protein
MHRISLNLQEINMNILYIKNVTGWEKINKIRRAPSAMLERLSIHSFSLKMTTFARV